MVLCGAVAAALRMVCGGSWLCGEIGCRYFLHGWCDLRLTRNQKQTLIDYG